MIQYNDLNPVNKPAFKFDTKLLILETLSTLDWFLFEIRQFYTLRSMQSSWILWVISSRTISHAVNDTSVNIPNLKTSDAIHCDGNFRQVRSDLRVENVITLFFPSSLHSNIPNAYTNSRIEKKKIERAEKIQANSLLLTSILLYKSESKQKKNNILAEPLTNARQ